MIRPSLTTHVRHHRLLRTLQPNPHLRRPLCQKILLIPFPCRLRSPTPLRSFPRRRSLSQRRHLHSRPPLLHRPPHHPPCPQPC
jgi:hypothetical protein